jgi:hypothetical protein
MPSGSNNDKNGSYTLRPMLLEPFNLPLTLMSWILDMSLSSLLLPAFVIPVTASALRTDEYAYCWDSRLVSNNLCHVDQTVPPPDLTQCGDSTLFFVWRPKARFIAPRGWMNDPQGGSIELELNDLSFTDQVTIAYRLVRTLG